MLVTDIFSRIEREAKKAKSIDGKIYKIAVWFSIKLKEKDAEIEQLKKRIND